MNRRYDEELFKWQTLAVALLAYSVFVTILLITRTVTT